MQKIKRMSVIRLLKTIPKTAMQKAWSEVSAATAHSFHCCALSDLRGQAEQEQMGLNRLLCRGKPWNCMDIGWGPDHTTGKHGRVRVRIMAKMERERRVKIGMI